MTEYEHIQEEAEERSGCATADRATVMSLSHTTDSIENYIKLLYDNRELIAQAY